jgi:hypothetical protein
MDFDTRQSQTTSASRRAAYGATSTPRRASRVAALSSHNVTCVETVLSCDGQGPRGLTRGFSTRSLPGSPRPARPRAFVTGGRRVTRDSRIAGSTSGHDGPTPAQSQRTSRRGPKGSGLRVSTAASMAAGATRRCCMRCASGRSITGGHPSRGTGATRHVSIPSRARPVPGSVTGPRFSRQPV